MLTFFSVFAAKRTQPNPIQPESTQLEPEFKTPANR